MEKLNWIKRGERLFGADRIDWKMQCPSCRQIWQGVDYELADKRKWFGRQCLGAHFYALGMSSTVCEHTATPEDGIDVGDGFFAFPFYEGNDDSTEWLALNELAVNMLAVDMDEPDELDDSLNELVERVLNH